MDNKNDKEPEDLRLTVIGNYVTKSFRFKPEKWLKVMENKDHRVSIQELNRFSVFVFYNKLLN